MNNETQQRNLGQEYKMETNKRETFLDNLILLSSDGSTRDFWRTFYHDGRNYHVVQQEFAEVGTRFDLGTLGEAYERAVQFALDNPDLPVLHVEYYE